MVIEQAPQLAERNLPKKLAKRLSRFVGRLFFGTSDKVNSYHPEQEVSRPIPLEIKEVKESGGERVIPGRTVGILTDLQEVRNPDDMGFHPAFLATEGHFSSHAPLLEAEGLDAGLHSLYYFYIKTSNGYGQKLAVRYEAETSLSKATAFVRFVDPNRESSDFAMIRNNVRNALVSRFAGETSQISITEELKYGNNPGPGEMIKYVVPGELGQPSGTIRR